MSHKCGLWDRTYQAAHVEPNYITTQAAFFFHVRMSKLPALLINSSLYKIKTTTIKRNGTSFSIISLQQNTDSNWMTDSCFQIPACSQQLTDNLKTTKTRVRSEEWGSKAINIDQQTIYRRNQRLKPLLTRDVRD